MNQKIRNNGRSFNELRPLKVQYNVYGYAASSVLFELGNTKVQCSVTLQEGVPPFLRNQGVGWLTAEYSMLPTATTTRSQRDSSLAKPNGRSVEISRLISRSLRTIVDLKKLGEKTIFIDCDVLQADGGTRTACITAASVALERAVAQWISDRTLTTNIMTDAVAAVSAGVWKGIPVLDPDFAEDSEIDADFNFILTRSGGIVEIQGTAEKSVISWQQFGELQHLAVSGVEKLFAYFNEQNGTEIQAVLNQAPTRSTASSHDVGNKKRTAPMFSLMNRG